MTTVIIVGADRPEALESSYARAFKQLGWQVLFWQPLAAYGSVTRGGKVGQFLGLFVHIEPWWRRANLQFLQLVNEIKPDLILVIGTQGVRAGTLAQLRVRHPQLVIYCIYPDSPHNLDTDRIHCLPFFDRVTTSSPAWVQAFTSLGARRVAYLPFAADTDLYQPTELPTGHSALTHDLTFIGTWRAEREILLNELADYDLVVWGSNYWQKRTQPHSPLRQKWGGRSLIGPEFAQACSQSKIMLNMMDAISWPGPNMRTFELPACRAFALTERSAAVLEIFREGETIECFDGLAEAREKISFYLKHENSREQIAAAAPISS